MSDKTKLRDNDGLAGLAAKAVNIVENKTTKDEQHRRSDTTPMTDMMEDLMDEDHELWDDVDVDMATALDPAISEGPLYQRFRDKVTFFLGVTNLCVLAFCAGGHGIALIYFYTFKFFTLLPLRIVEYWNENVYFLLDFCYFANVRDVFCIFSDCSRLKPHPRHRFSSSFTSGSFPRRRLRSSWPLASATVPCSGPSRSFATRLSFIAWARSVSREGGGREGGRVPTHAGRSTAPGACERIGAVCFELPCVSGTDLETPFAHAMNSLRFHPHQPRAGHLCHSLVLDRSIRRFRLSAFS